MIQFGLRLHDAEKLPVEQVLPLVRQKGFTCAHVALSKSFRELPCTPSALTPGYALYLRHLFEKNGIDIAVLGNYLNLAHPDADALHAIQEKILCPYPLCKPVGLRHGGHRDRCAQRGVQILSGVPQRRSPCYFYPELQAGGALCRAVRRDHCH